MDFPTLEMWGALAPISIPIIWENNEIMVELHILTVAENALVTRSRATVDPELSNLTENVERIARSLVTINGQSVAETFATIDKRVEWIKETWSENLLDAFILAYEFASRQPFIKLAENLGDPNTEAAPIGNGERSKAAASSTVSS